MGYVGHDWAALVGFLLALCEPSRISRMVSLSIPHLWPSRHDRLNPWRLGAFAYQAPLSTPLVGEAVMRAGATRRLLRAITPKGTYSEEDLELYDASMGSPCPPGSWSEPATRSSAAPTSRVTRGTRRT